MTESFPHPRRCLAAQGGIVIQPRQSFAAGFGASIHDPVWFLARQWQMGEHQGENATSPVLVRFEAVHAPLKPHAAVPALDPTVVPAEAIVEGGPDDGGVHAGVDRGPEDHVAADAAEAVKMGNPHGLSSRRRGGFPRVAAIRILLPRRNCVLG